MYLLFLYYRYLLSPIFCLQTNIAVLTMLNKLAKHCNKGTSEFDLNAFKIIYFSMKLVLVQEMPDNRH